MPALRETGPYIYPTWLPKLLAGLDRCEWKIWGVKGGGKTYHCGATYLDYPKPLYRELRGLERGELDPTMDELYPNYWHTTDYMHHSVLGPVAVIIRPFGEDSHALLKAGTYWMDLTSTEWAQDPSVSSPETARIGERPLLRLGERRLAPARP